MSTTAATEEKVLSRSRSSSRPKNRVGIAKKVEDSITVATGCSMASTAVEREHLSPNESTDTMTIVSQRLKIPHKQPSVNPKQSDEGPTYDLMALPQPTRVPADPQPSGKPPYDLSPNALASNQNLDERRGRPHVGLCQTKNTKWDKPNARNFAKSDRVFKKPTSRGRQAKKDVSRSANSPIVTDGNPVSYDFLVPSIAGRTIPYCNPSLVTTCPKPLTPVRMCDPELYLSYQINMARHLAYNGISGPYLVGDFLCDIYLADASFIKIACRKVDPHGHPFWCHMMTGERLQPQDGSKATGKPVALINGALCWMEDEKCKIIPPEWAFVDPHDVSFDPQILRDPTTVPQQLQFGEIETEIEGNEIGMNELDTIQADAADPDFPTGDFSRRLHQMGIADSNPTYSPSSTAATPFRSSAASGPHFTPTRSNPTLVALGARDRLQDEAEEDFANMGRDGRRFLDMRTLVDAMKFRDRGIPEKDIEAKLRIQPGLLSKLGQEKTFSHVTSPN
ncbi:hypothetical protein FLONG3_4477 [Fusarium longipes]|uniref:Helix-turn-helix domain-containing protein n=1 Tax=Fusarium longipes TaxID=694270 RepID=A0A395SYV4_9HYPO|nr:hypothetical protein FLONG3_4477 [Fusarium longipes]